MGRQRRRNGDEGQGSSARWLLEVVRRRFEAPSCVAMTIACVTPLDSPG